MKYNQKSYNQRVATFNVKKLFSVLAVILVSLTQQLNAQIFPVSATTQVTPPYSVFLGDYAVPETNQLKLNLILRDVTEPTFDVRLHFKIEGAGISISSRRSIAVPPITLEGGVPRLLTAVDLAPYLDNNNLDFSGITRQQYERSGALPDGFYRMCFTVVDYRRPDVVLSRESCANAWFVLNDPPRVNLPQCGTVLPLNDPQNIFFQWLPMNTGSPNTAFTTEYELSVYEIRPAGRNPNEVIRTSTPIYQTTTDFTTYLYGLAEPALIPGQSYAFRVRAKDKNGRDLFKNQGYSEVCSFTFGEVNPLEAPTNLRISETSERRTKIDWDLATESTSYSLEYRKVGNASNKWFTTETQETTLSITDLEPSTDYEVRIYGKLNAFKSAPSPVETFTTLAPREFMCGSVYGAVLPENTNPMLTAMVGNIIKVGNFEMKLLEVSGGDGVFSGYGAVMIPYLGTRIVSKFINVKINELQELYQGEVIALTEGVDGLRDRWESDEEEGDGEDGGNTDGQDGSDGDIQIDHPGDIDSVYVDETTGGIVVVNEDGETTTYEQPVDEETGEKETVTITDENGNTWTVGSDGTVTEGAGSPTSPAALSSQDSINFIVKFNLNPNQIYGFDKKNNEGFVANYQQTEILDEAYWIPWKSVESGTRDLVNAQVEGLDTFPESIGFKSLTAAAQAQADMNADKKQVWAQGGLNGDTDQLKVYVLKEDEEGNEQEIEVGRVNIASYDKIRKKLVLVPVNDADLPNALLLKQQLNEIFKSAVAEWDVVLDDRFIVEPEMLEDFDAGQSGMLASFPKKMREFNRAFKQSRTEDKDAYHLFLIKGVNTSRSGFMPFKRHFGYIYTDNVTDQSQTIAHELSHGAFRLRHTFSEFPAVAQGSTGNLMDYSTSTDAKQLLKYQWDNIHNPQDMVGWFQDDEESAQEQEGIVSHVEKKLKDLAEELNSKLFSVIHCEKCESKPDVEITDGLSYIEITPEKLSGLSYNNNIFSDFESVSVIAIEQIRKGDGVCYAFYFSADDQSEIAFHFEEMAYKPNDEDVIDKKLTLLDTDNNIGYQCTNQLGPWSQVICSFQSASNLTQQYVDDLFSQIENCQKDFSDLVGKYTSLTPKQITYIYEDGQLLKIDSENGFSIENASIQNYEALLVRLKNNELSDNDAVVYKKLSTGYEININFGKNIIPKEGYDLSGTAKDDSEQILESILNAKLSLVNSLNDKNSQSTPGEFNDGRSIEIKETDWWESVTNIVVATNEFISEVEIKEKYWDSNNTEYTGNWINTPPYLSGGGNAIIEEIREIPELVAMIANIAVDEPTRTQLWTALKDLDKDKIVNGLSGMATDYVNTFTEGGDPSWHQGGKTTVQVATIFFGGALKKGAGAIKDNIDEISAALKKKADDVLNEALDILGELRSKFDDDLSFDAFKDDFADNIAELRKFKDNPDLVDAWKKIDDLGDNAFNQLKKDPDFLKKLDDVVKNDGLNKHVLEGDISYEILEAGQKKWKVGGVHHKAAFDNGKARIKSGTKSTPDANGYYTAKVEVYHPEFPDNGGFKVKSKESTFFPDDWGIDKLRAEIAGAIKNKGTPTVYPDGRKLYKGTMTDGTELAIWENAAGNITSTYPVL